MGNISYRILDTVKEINPRDWDALFGDNPEGYGFYKTLDESHLEYFIFRYLVIYKDKEPCLIAPFFISYLDLAIACNGLLRKAIQSIRRYFPRFLSIKTLFFGSAFSEYGCIGIKADTPPDTGLQGLMGVMLQAIKEFSGSERIRFIVFKDFLKQDSELLEPLRLKGYLKLKSYPSMTTELRFGDTDGYLSSLSYSTRKNLRRKLKAANSSFKIKIEERGSVADIIDQVHSLYMNNYSTGDTKFEKLNREFFLNISKNMPECARYFLYYVDGKLSAFNLCFIRKDLFIDKFVGFDYDMSYKANLYFVSWYFNVGWCIKNKIPLYQTGQTDYEAKVRLGGEAVPLYIYMKHRNRFMNLLIKILAVFLKPENFEEAIRENEG